MGVTTQNYGVAVCFCPKVAILCKTVGWHLWILSKNLNSLKTHKNSYTRTLCITSLQYGGHDQQIQSVGQFLAQTGDFR
jgi:hypothetical protein